MVEIASIELCEELYTLSEWRDDINGFYDASEFEGYFKEQLLSDNQNCPAYTAGYLLRKLSGKAEVGVQWLKTDFYLAKTGYEWRFKRATAETPEDALCKLAIELFKNGTLTKEK